MRTMGLRTTAFWASWLTYGGALALASTAVLQASGYAAGFDFFVNSSFAATFALFLGFGVSMLSLAVLLSTLLSSARTAQTVGYSVILVGFVLQFLITSMYAGILDLFYAVQVRRGCMGSLGTGGLSSRPTQLQVSVGCGTGHYDLPRQTDHLHPPPSSAPPRPPPPTPAGVAVGGRLPLPAAAVPALQFCKGVLRRVVAVVALHRHGAGQDHAGAYAPTGRWGRGDVHADSTPPALPRTAHLYASSHPPLQGPGFTWADMFTWRARSFLGFECMLPPPAHALGLLAADTALFLLAAFYLDAVLPGPHGSPAHPLFFLGYSYHAARRRPSSASAAAGSKGDPTPLPPTDAGVAAETALAEAYELHRDEAAAAAAQSVPSRADAAAAPAPTSAALAAEVMSLVSPSDPGQPGEGSVLGTTTHRGGVQSPLWPRSDGGGGGTDSSPPPLPPLDDVVVCVTHLRVVYRRGLRALLHGLGCGRRNNHDAPSTTPAASVPAPIAGAALPGEVVSVVDLSLTVRRHECLSLLGHNGAGKTTTLGVLMGLLAADAGSASVCGLDVATQMPAVQRVMGVCPQHDILWPQLTAAETLRLFAAIKGVPRAGREAEVARVLSQVQLASSAGRPVGAYSGGMRRRVSFAIACLGDPAVVYLDEPTTGLDPLNRLKVWRLIQRLKKTSSVVLTTVSCYTSGVCGEALLLKRPRTQQTPCLQTTALPFPRVQHNMDEAAVLGDRVGIMAQGRLCALGTPLRLKNAYGTGYRLSLVLASASDAVAAAVVDGVTARAPGAQLALRDASSLDIVLPFSELAAIPAVLTWVDSVTTDAAAAATAAEADAASVVAAEAAATATTAP